MSNEQNATPGIEGAADRYVRQHTINILYTNHRGETARRRIQPLGLRFGVSARHPDPQWLLEAIDLDKNAERSFALSGLRGDVSETVPPRKSLLDQIHAVKEFAERWGYPDLAEWITKHADEPCPAAIAQAMGMGDGPFAGESFCSTHGETFAASQGEVCPQCGFTDPPSPSEPSRKDAVKEAIALGVAHAGCQPMTPCLADAGWRSETMCDQALRNRPILAALADAERKLDDSIPRDLYDKHVREWQGMYAAAEKRAKDAEDGWRAATTHPRGAFCAVFSWPHGQRCSDKAEEHYAALTRKLATARGLLTSIKKIAGREPLGEWESKVYFEASLGIAAIDVPAGEEAPGLPTHNDFAWLAEVTHNGVPVYFGGDFWTSDPNEAVRFARQQDAEQTIRLIPLHPNPKAIEHGWFTSPAPASAAPPPEPANTQGSGDAEEPPSPEPCVAIEDLPLEGQNNICGRPLASHCPFPNDGCALQHHGYRSTEPPPSAPRFTAAVRREVSQEPFSASACRYNASCHDLEVGRLLDEATEQGGGPALMQMAEAHSQTAATFRAYADLLERDDVLERAAEEAVRIWSECGYGPTHAGAMHCLRSVLAQRAKGKQ